MSKKKVWLSWLPSGEGSPDPTPAIAGMQKSGVNLIGATPWNDDLSKHGWTELAGALSDEEGPEVWVIVGRNEDLEKDTIRYGLGLTNAMVRHLRQKNPVAGIVVGLDGKPEADSLPALLDGFVCVDGSGSTWAAKVVIALHKKQQAAAKTPYRLNILAHEYFGQWFEVGPVEGSWEGMMFGISGGGEDTFLQEHAVGPEGDLPERTTLEYPMHGIKCEIGGAEYTACAVKNTISTEESYWVQVKGKPERLFFGNHPDAEEQEAWVIDLT